MLPLSSCVLPCMRTENWKCWVRDSWILSGRGESWDSSQSGFSSLISELRKLEWRDTEMTCSGPCKWLMAKWRPWRGPLYFMTTALSTPLPSISKHWFIPSFSSHTSVPYHIYLSCVSFSWILYLTLTSGTLFFPSSSQSHTWPSTHYPSDNVLSPDLTNTRNTVPIYLLFPYSHWPFLSLECNRFLWLPCPLFSDIHSPTLVQSSLIHSLFSGT